MITTAIAALMSLQAAGEIPIAIKNETPERWSVEYPRVIIPYVRDYRRCLNYSNRQIRGVADFEIQHRADLPRCEDVREIAIAKSKEVVARADFGEEFTVDDVELLFDNIGRIHIARGADIDQQFTIRLQASNKAQDEYHESQPKPDPFVPLEDPSVVTASAGVGGSDAPN